MDRIELKLPGIEEFFTKEAYKVLRTNIQFCGQDIKTIAITSCNENEGKTTISLHIAKSFSELGKKVLVIDGDMRKSVMAGRNTNAQNMAGLSEVLTGMSLLTECVYSTQFDNLNLLFAGKYPPNPVELLSSKHFSVFLTEAKKIYDYIIVDTPPLGQVIDAAVIASNCDGTILVIGDEKAHYRQAQEVIEQLNRSDCKILGAVRNCTKKRSGRYYRSKKYYSKYSGYGYGNNAHRIRKK